MNSNRILSWQQFQLMMDNEELLLDKDLTAFTREQEHAKPGWSVYRMRDGEKAYLRVGPVEPLLVFASTDRLKRAVQQIRRHRSKRKHFFHDFITDQHLRFRTAEDDLQYIATRLSIDPSALDTSIQSVAVIQSSLCDANIRGNVMAEEKKLFYALGNYIGDIIYQKNGGWSYMMDRKGETILPSSVRTSEGGVPINWFRIYSRLFMGKQFERLLPFVESIVR